MLFYLHVVSAIGCVKTTNKKLFLSYNNAIIGTKPEWVCLVVSHG